MALLQQIGMYIKGHGNHSFRIWVSFRYDNETLHLAKLGLKGTFSWKSNLKGPTLQNSM